MTMPIAAFARRLPAARLSIAIAIAGLVATPFAAAARHHDLAPAHARDEDRWTRAAVARCLRARPNRLPAPIGRPATASGLIGGDAVRAGRLAAANGPAIAYVGTDPKVARCGVAFYGPVSAITVQHIVGQIGAMPRLLRQSPDLYPVATAPADAIYWADPLGPDSRGVILLLRRPGSGAPTLEVESRRRLAN